MRETNKKKCKQGYLKKYFLQKANSPADPNKKRRRMVNLLAQDRSNLTNLSIRTGFGHRFQLLPQELLLS
jgi:hypothetical protein